MQATSAALRLAAGVARIGLADVAFALSITEASRSRGITSPLPRKISLGFVCFLHTTGLSELFSLAFYRLVPPLLPFLILAFRPSPITLPFLHLDGYTT